MANTKITSRVIADDAISTDMIQDNAITSAKIGVDVIVAEDLAANSITVSELNKTALSGQSAVTAVGADYILIGDTSDSDNLKKSLLSDVIEDTTLSTEQVQDIVGAMFTSNTETRVAATYEDGDGTIDLVVDDMTANDNTWRPVTAGGNTLTSSETLAFTAGTGISIAESAGAVTITNSIADTNLTTEEVQDIVGAMFSSNTETGITVTYEDGDGTIDLVVGTLNQDTTGSAATLTTGRTIAMTGDVTWTTTFDGSGNVTAAGTIANAAVNTAKIQNDSINADKIADDAIDSEHYTDGSIDTAHIAADQITSALIADDQIDSEHIVDGSIDLAHMSVNSIDSDQYVDGSIDAVHLAPAQTNITSVGTLTGLTLSSHLVMGDSDEIRLGDSTDMVFKHHSSGYGHLENKTGTLYLDSETFTIRTDIDDLAAAITIDAAQQVTFGGNVVGAGAITTLTNFNSTSGNDLRLNAGSANRDVFVQVNGTTLLTAVGSTGAIKAAKSAMISQVALVATSGNACAWDAAAAANAFLGGNDWTQNTTFSAPSNATEGAIISVEIAQGGTVYTIAWNTIFEFAASTAPTVTATASKTDIYTFRYNGSVWQEIGRVQNMAQT